MRKDLFVVGARLIGIWQLTAALNSLALLVAYWAGFVHQAGGGLEYTKVRFAGELVIGLYLLLKTDHLFELLTARGGEAAEPQP